MCAARDTYRSRVYTAERQVMRTLDRADSAGSTITCFGTTLVIPAEYKFGTFDSAAQYVHQLQHTGWYADMWADAARQPTKVRQRRSGKRAHYESGCIALHGPDGQHSWTLREMVVLHELAHHVVRCQLGPDVAPHGNEFLSAYLTLLERQIGPEVGLLLRAALNDSSVPYRPANV